MGRVRNSVKRAATLPILHRFPTKIVVADALPLGFRGWGLALVIARSSFSGCQAGWRRGCGFGQSPKIKPRQLGGVSGCVNSFV